MNMTPAQRSAARKWHALFVRLNADSAADEQHDFADEQYTADQIETISDNEGKSVSRSEAELLAKAIRVLAAA